MYSRLGKRLLDIIVSLTLLLLLSPFLAAIAMALYRETCGRPIFIQVRPGKNERPIRILKFRTMTDETDENGELLPDNRRITRIGSVLRKTSIDELPQLINVLKGDMSLVGPRPLLFRYIPFYTEEQRRRHAVKPGLTGWAQVNGRNGITWTKKFEYDVYYVDHVSLMFDLKIILRTIVKVLKREGINQSSDRPMTPFNGYN